MSSELVTKPPPSDGLTTGDGIALAAASEAPTEPRREIWFRRRLDLRTQLREVWQFRELALTLAERDLRARYKQALLGFAWAIVTPLMLMVAFTFLFTRFAKVDSHGVPYALFSYVALVPWTFFNGAVSSGGNSIISNMPVLNKVYCPRELFPIAAMAVAAVDAIISVAVLGVIFLLTHTTPHVEGVYVLVLVPVLVIFTLAVTLATSALLVFLRDLRHALPLLLQFALFATPVAYGLDAITHSRTFLLVYSGLNPLGPVIDGFRRTLLFGRPPDWPALGVGAASSLVLLAISYKLFKRLETGFADIA
jgi:ABC-2 type transport system permease protein/lipopolysaccharide transport system permease protein